MIEVISSITTVSSALDALTDLMPKLIGFASVTAAFLPPPELPGHFSRIHRAVNVLAFNFNKARNQG